MRRALNSWVAMLAWREGLRRIVVALSQPLVRASFNEWASRALDTNEAARLMTRALAAITRHDIRISLNTWTAYVDERRGARRRLTAETF